MYIRLICMHDMHVHCMISIINHTLLSTIRAVHCKKMMVELTHVGYVSCTTPF